MSQPEIFIIESLDFEDERANRFEGRIISQILALSEKKCEYCYIRTKRELKTLLERWNTLLLHTTATFTYPATGTAVRYSQPWTRFHSPS